MVTTGKINKLGWAGVTDLIRLLEAYNSQELPAEFYGEGDISFGFNAGSRLVFLTNEEFQTLLLDEEGKFFVYKEETKDESELLDDRGEEYE